MKNEEQLILVDVTDQHQGCASKTHVHTKALLHRAFSVMVYNSSGELLLQKRADSKYHSAGLWANSCCGHPRNKETTKAAAKRRLYEELGFTCDLSKVTELSYFLSLGDGMYENEYTHVFAGQYEGNILPNPVEVSNIQWITPEALKKNYDLQPDIHSKWLQLYLSDYYYKIFI